MVQIAMSGEAFFVDGNPLVGFTLVGYTQRSMGVILKLDRYRLLHLAQACEEPYKSLFLGICGLLAPPPSAMPSRTEDASKGAASQIPKKFRPYLKYTDEQIKAAWDKSELRSDRHYALSGHVRLYLTRAMLEEMYRQPHHLRILYADMLKRVDAASSESTSHLCHFSTPTPPPDCGTRSRFRPYERLNEQEMMRAVKRLDIPLAQAKPSYGYFAVTLRRDTLLLLTGRSPFIKPAMAYLLKLFDATDPPG